MSYLERVERELHDIESAERYRRIDGARTSRDFSSNDYLALASDPSVVAALGEAGCAGAGGARLLGGRHPAHDALERELARFVGRERALVFSSGYLCALGVLPTLAALVDRAYSDRLNHASLIDGLRSAATPRTIYPHGSPPPRDARVRRALIVTETLFSMDGDLANARAIASDLGDDDILIVDEAHALGVVGERGAGVAFGIDDPRIVVLGTLSKAFGAQGGFVAGPARVIDLIVNRARTFIFDTALAPPLCTASLAALSILRSADDRRAHLVTLSRRLRAGLRDRGFDVANDETPIVPIPFGSERRAIEAAAALLAAGITAPAIRPPTVPPGESRIRISLRSDHTPRDIDALFAALDERVERPCIAIS